jgi:4-amino-4-deoxy-L-arabinose transferase-like glycosyltransferase
MSDAATAAQPHPWLLALGRVADTLSRHVAAALAAILAAQVLATAALFFSVNHNGWLTYQGGDQIWLVTSGWLLGQGSIGYAFTSYGWPMLLAPLTWITGSSSVDLLPLTTILQVAVLGPLATLAVYDIGARLAGRLAGLWCAAVFVAAPFAAIPFFVDRYHDSWVDQLLPQALGLTQQADFPSVVAVLVSAALTVRALQAGANREAVLAGTIAGVALAVKPANALFLAAPAVAFLLARRWRQAALFAAALAPALIALTLWKAKGLGTVPLFAQSTVTLAAGLGDPVLAESWFQRTFDIDFETWKQNMSNLREFTWSARIVQFLPLAGAIAVARRSVPAAGLLLTWLLGYVLVKGAASVATIESGSYWRLVMPALPAFALLAAAVPLLVPTLLERMGDRLAPTPGRRPGLRLTAGLVTLLGALPIAVLLLSSPQRADGKVTPPVRVATDALIVDNIAVPSDPDVVSLAVRRTARGNELVWTDSTRRAATFYRVYRATHAGGFPDMVCERRGVDRCELRSETLGTTRERRWVDPSPPADAVYRVGVAANWLDETDRGDVFALSPPVAPSR